jgi:hypothetical protein
VLGGTNACHRRLRPINRNDRRAGHVGGGGLQDEEAVRLIPPIESYPSWQRFAQTPTGRVVLVGIFTLGLLLARVRNAPELGAVLLAISLFPSHRRLLSALGTIYWLGRSHYWIAFDRLDPLAVREGPAAAVALGRPFRAVVVVATLAACAVVIHLLRRHWKLVAGIPPAWVVLILHAWLVVIVATAPLTGVVRVALWGSVLTFSSYLTWVAYSVQDPPKEAPGRLWLDITSSHAFWGIRPLALAIPKGGANLQRLEAAEPAQLAVTQLKGLKLLTWALVLVAVNALGRPVVVRLVPSETEAFLASVNGHPLAWHIGWLSVIAMSLLRMLEYAISSHLTVACVRMAGFSASRNMYRPLSATTIADFWNRYLFYYKEYLVDVFFMPVYRRWFRRQPRLRLVVAVFVAACLGNSYMHFVWWGERIMDLGLWQALLGFRAFAFYSVLLAIGITVSQLRKRGRPPGTVLPLWRRPLASVQVVLFYFIIQLFGSFPPQYGLGDHFAFLATLVPGLPR